MQGRYTVEDTWLVSLTIQPIPMVKIRHVSNLRAVRSALASIARP